MQDRRTKSQIYLDILQSMTNGNTVEFSIRTESFISADHIKTYLFQILKYRLVQLTLTKKNRREWNITPKGTDYLSKLKPLFDKADRAFNTIIKKDFYFVEKPTRSIKLIDLIQGNNARKAIIEELEA